MHRALTMPLAERISRHSEMMAIVKNNDIHHWQERFLAALKQIAPRSADTQLQDKIATFQKLA